jgi:hypothetical protein
MRYIIYLITLISVLILYSCSFFEDDKDKFIETYRELLIIREMYKDTSRVNKEIGKLFEKNGYDWNSFTEEYNSYKEKPETFMQIMDSVRERNQRELLEYRNKK